MNAASGFRRMGPGNPPANFSVVNLVYSSATSPGSNACGNFVGGTITIYEYFRRDNGSLGHCTQQNLVDILAHEFGHRLGLNDVNENGIGCEENIMASINSLDHDIAYEECAAADSRNTTDAERNNGCDSPLDCHMSPIVLKLDEGAWRLTSVEEGVAFDFDGDGIPARTGWTPRNRKMAFLFTDLNGDGCLTSGRELFGDSMEVPWIGHYLNGFEALAPWDTNGDGWVAAGDNGFGMLRLWTDRNHDGRCSPSEVARLSDEGVMAIRLAYRPHHRVDSFGNEYRLVSQALRRNPDGGLRLERIFDIYFRVEP